MFSIGPPSRGTMFELGFARTLVRGHKPQEWRHPDLRNAAVLKGRQGCFINTLPWGAIVIFFLGNWIKTSPCGYSYCGMNCPMALTWWVRSRETLTSIPARGFVMAKELRQQILTSWGSWRAPGQRSEEQWPLPGSGEEEGGGGWGEHSWDCEGTLASESETWVLGLALFACPVVLHGPPLLFGWFLYTFNERVDLNLDNS